MKKSYRIHTFTDEFDAKFQAVIDDQMIDLQSQGELRNCPRDQVERQVADIFALHWVGAARRAIPEEVFTLKADTTIIEATEFEKHASGYEVPLVQWKGNSMQIFDIPRLAYAEEVEQDQTMSDLFTRGQLIKRVMTNDEKTAREIMEKHGKNAAQIIHASERSKRVFGKVTRGESIEFIFTFVAEPYYKKIIMLISAALVNSDCAHEVGSRAFTDAVAQVMDKAIMFWLGVGSPEGLPDLVKTPILIKERLTVNEYKRDDRANVNVPVVTWNGQTDAANEIALCIYCQPVQVEENSKSLSFTTRNIIVGTPEPPTVADMIGSWFKSLIIIAEEIR